MSQVLLLEEGYTAHLAALVEGLEPWVHLYVNDPPLTRDMSRGSLVEAFYDGYAPVSLRKWTPPALQGGVAFSYADHALFTYTVGVGPLPIRGYFVTNARDGSLLWVWRKGGEPIPMGPVIPQVIVAVVMRFPLICPPGP